MRILCSLLTLFLIGCQTEGKKDTAIINGKVIMMTDTSYHISSDALIIREGIIQDIIPMEELSPSSYHIIDASNQYILPGLIDMHTHVYNRNDLISYLNFGVTTVFNLRGYSYHLAWQYSLNSGKWMGPRLIAGGPTTDGYPMTTYRNFAIDTKEEAWDFVGFCKQQGYQAIKVYNNYDPEVYYHLINMANAQGIPVVGHIPRKVGIEGVIQNGQKMIAHGEEFFHSYQRDHGVYPDSSHVNRFAEMLSTNDVALTPNISAIDFMIHAATDIDEYLRQDEADYLSSTVYHSWLPQNNGYSRRPDPQAFVRRNRQMKKFVKELTIACNHKEVTILAGTDVSVTGFPGMWLWQELFQLHDAGLSNFEAIKAATLNAGKFVGEEISKNLKIGEIKAGYHADLLFFKHNPLHDLEHLHTLNAVVKGGRFISNKELTSAREKNRRLNQELHEIIDRFEQFRAEDQHRQAVDWMHDVQEQFPQEQIFDYSVLNRYARQLYGENRHVLAVFVLKFLTKRYPDAHPTYNMLASLSMEEGDTLAAKTYLEQSLKINPFDNGAQSMWAKINGQTTTSN